MKAISVLHQARHKQRPPLPTAARPQEIPVVNTTPGNMVDVRQYDGIDIRDIWARLNRRKLTIVLTALLFFALMMTLTLLKTPLYRSGVTLEIAANGERVLEFDVETQSAGAVFNEKNFYQTQYELLKSRNLARRVIDQLGLESKLGREPVQARTGKLDQLRSWLRQQLGMKDDTLPEKTWAVFRWRINCSAASVCNR
ncbi:MAG: Wzz/FepE/Etk N-terminal domain-containing protein [Thiolinea sp.]